MRADGSCGREWAGTAEAGASAGVDEAGTKGLDSEAVGAIAMRVVELLEGSRSETRFVSAAELAHLLGVSRATVYEKAHKLGAIRLGTGPRARLRFDVEQVLSQLNTGAERKWPPPSRIATVERTRRSSLLPIRGAVPR